MAIENRKQLLFIVVAVAAGIIAAVLMSNYVTKSINDRTTQLAEEYEAKQKETVTQIRSEHEQKMAAMAQEIERVKTEQVEAIKKQIAALQQATAQKAPAEPQRKRSKISLAYKTPEGKRAVTVMIDSLSAVGGLLNAGDFVDIIAHLNVPAPGAVVPEAKKNTNTLTAMVFQSLQVLAVNTNIDETGYYDEQQAAPALKVTFAVDPQEAGLLVFADKNGKLELALRSPNERDKQMVKASTWKTLADYVLQNQGATIGAASPEEPTDENMKEDVPEPKQNIQIFKAGKEL